MASNHQLAYDGHNDHSDPFDPTPYDYAGPYQNYQQPPNQQAETRSAPPVGPPPAYYRIINKTYSRSLRPILLFVCFISLLYLVLLGIQDFRTASDSGVNGKYKLFTIIQGILFMAAAGIEILGLVSTYTQKLSLARMYSFLSLLAFGAVIASEIIGIIILYTFKTDVITQCSNYLQGNSSANYGWFGSTVSNTAPETAAEANADCNSLWAKTRTWDIVWLIITTCLGGIFVMISFAYARELADPNSVRSKSSSASARFGGQQQNGNWHSNYAYDPEAQQHSYPPPPMGANPAYAPPQGAPPPPEYKVRPSMDDVDFDAKTPAGADYGYGYVQEPRYEYETNVPRANRPGSSRSVRREVDEETEGEDDKRKDSGETLRGDPALKAGKSVGHHEDDDVPRI